MLPSVVMGAGGLFAAYFLARKNSAPQKLNLVDDAKTLAIVRVDKTPVRDPELVTCRGWGFADTTFEFHESGHLYLTGSRYAMCGKPMTAFTGFIEKELGFETHIVPSMASEANYRIAPAPARIEDSEVDAWVSKRYGESKSSTKEIDRIKHSHGHTHEDMWALKHGFKRVVDTVVWAETEQDVRDLLAYANEGDIMCVIPFGGGSNVSHALSCNAEERRVIISLDMSRLNNVRWINRVNNTAEVEAGAIGVDLDKSLNEAGFHTGHEPDSNEFSTLGGWISTCASGMKQARYGNIEDILVSVTLVTPTGDLEKYESHPRTSTSFDLNQLIIGSEGNLGVIVSAVIRVRPLPEVQEYDSILFPTFKDGVNFFRHVSQEGVVPASMRLVDNRQFQFGQVIKPPKTGFFAVAKSAIEKFFVLKIKGFDKDKMSACTLVFEGPKHRVALERATLQRLAPLYGGMFAGSESGKAGFHLTYAIAYIRDIAARLDIMAESFETTVPWDKIHAVTAAVAKAAEEQHIEKELPGKGFMSWRISQVYETGVCIYFYYAFRHTGIESPAAMYTDIEIVLRQAVMTNGGSLSHHHGVGKIRQSFLPQVFSKTSILTRFGP